MTENIIIAFDTFREAFDFLNQKRKEGMKALYYPTGGDHPKRLTTQEVKHKVLVLKEDL